MARTVLAFILLCIVPSVAVAKNTCIVIDTPGQFLDDQFVLLKAKLAPGDVAPVQGYLAQFDSTSGTYINFFPISGQSVINSLGSGALGVIVHNVTVSGNGGGSSSLPNPDVQLFCEPTPGNKKLELLDMCFGSYGSNTISAHLITCGKSIALP